MLEPLAAIAPDMGDPVTGLTVARALSRGWQEAPHAHRPSAVSRRAPTTRAQRRARARCGPDRRGRRGQAGGVSGAGLHAVLPVLQPGRAARRSSRAEPVPGPTTDAFSRLAAELGVVIVLNLYEREGAAAYDSSPVIDADGRLLGTTRMLHVAQMPRFCEQDYYTPGRPRDAGVRDGRRPRRRGDLLRPPLPGGDAAPGPAARRPGRGAAGRDRWGSGPTGSTRRNCAWRRFRTAISRPWPTGWASSRR